MTAVNSEGSSSSTLPTPADDLGRYATQLRGEWSMGSPAVALKRLVPDLLGDHHKGQLGRVGIFGGSKDYTGAPFFASMSSLRTGADLAYVLTAEEAAPALKTYSPELMVTPVYSAATLRGMPEELSEAIAPLVPKFHSLVLGPGLGRDPRVQAGLPAVVRRVRQGDIPIVIDADALAMVASTCKFSSMKSTIWSTSRSPVAEEGGEGGSNSVVADGSISDNEASTALGIQGYSLAVLTPNVNEFRLLYRGFCNADPSLKGEKKKDGISSTPDEAVERLAKTLGYVTVALKGREDILSNGKRTISCAVPGGLKRCGGIGDVLSGAMGTMLGWVSIQGFKGEEAEEMRLWAAWWACAVTRHASRRAYEAHGRAMSATDVLKQMGGVLEEIAPSPPLG